MQCTAFFWLNFMNRYPRYVRVQSLPDKDGNTYPEWLVRGVSEEHFGPDGITKIKATEEQINRYYRCDTSIPAEISITSLYPSTFLRYEELQKDMNYIEYN